LKDGLPGIFHSARFTGYDKVEILSARERAIPYTLCLALARLGALRVQNKVKRGAGIPNPCNLVGRGVLVTRPAAQAEGLCRLVETAGGRAIRFPTVAIEPVADPGLAYEQLSRDWDLMLFVSRNAVVQALSVLPGHRLPAGPQLGAIGAATARALAAAGRAPDLVASNRSDSESLLALPQLADLTGQRVLIVRGVGGRRLLGDTLVERGARLTYAEVYRRVLPTADMASLLMHWRREVQLVTVTSGEILDNLLTLAGHRGRDLVFETPLVVVGRRVEKIAEALGFTRVEAAQGAADAAMFAALCRIAEAHRWC